MIPGTIDSLLSYQCPCPSGYYPTNVNGEGKIALTAGDQVSSYCDYVNFVPTCWFIGAVNSNNPYLMNIICMPNEGKFTTDCGCGSVSECSKTWDTTSHLRSDVVGINAGELFPQQDPESKQEGFYYNNPNGSPQKMDLFFYLGNQPIRDNQLSQLKSVWVLLWNYQNLIDDEVFIQVYTGPTFFTSRITFITDDWDRVGLTFVWISGNVNGVQLEEPDENVYKGVTRIELPYDSSQSIGPQSPTESLFGIKISSNSAWATNQLDMTVISAGYQLDCAREQVLFTFVEQFGQIEE